MQGANRAMCTNRKSGKGKTRAWLGCAMPPIRTPPPCSVTTAKCANATPPNGQRSRTPSTLLVTRSSKTGNPPLTRRLLISKRVTSRNGRHCSKKTAPAFGSLRNPRNPLPRSYSMRQIRFCRSARPRGCFLQLLPRIRRRLAAQLWNVKTSRVRSGWRRS